MGIAKQKNKSIYSVTLSVLVSFLFVFAFATSTTTITSSGITTTGGGGSFDTLNVSATSTLATTSVMGNFAIGTTTDENYALKTGGGNLYFQGTGDLYTRVDAGTNFSFTLFDPDNGNDTSDLILNTRGQKSYLEAEGGDGGWSGFTTGGPSDSRLGMYVDSPVGGMGEVIGLNYTANFSGLNTTGDGYTALKLNVTDAQAGADGNRYLMDLQLGSVSKFRIDSTGNLAGTIINSSSTAQNMFVGEGAGAANITGVNNFFGGFESGNNNTAGEGNVFLGEHSGGSNLSGSWDTFVGRRAGYNNTTGSYNAFFGQWAGNRNTTGGLNTFLGSDAGVNNKKGYSNTGVGFWALGRMGFSLLAGPITAITDDAGEALFTSVAHGLSGGETIIIRHSGAGNFDNQYTVVYVDADTFKISSDGGVANVAFVATSVNEQTFWAAEGLNTAIGSNAGEFTTTGSFNFFGGFEAGNLNDTGSRNSFIGYQAGYGSTNREDDVFLGYKAGYAGGAGDSVFIGSGAGRDSNNNGNVFVGYDAGMLNSLARESVAVGEDAGRKGESGFDNVYLGLSAGYFGTGSNNFFGGSGAGEFAQGSNLVAVGYQALHGDSANTGAYESVTNDAGEALFNAPNGHPFAGGEIVTIVSPVYGGGFPSYSAVYTVTGVSGNSFKLDDGGGNIAFISDDSGVWYLNTQSANTAIGYQAGSSNTTGSNNFFGGYQSGYSNTTGIRNVFIGADGTGYSNTTGRDNTFIGAQQTGKFNTTGSENTFIGNYVGKSNVAGSRNIAIGYDLFEDSQYGSDLIAIGYQALTNFNSQNGTIVSITDNGGSAHITTSAPHLLAGGELITIINTTNYNGDWIVTVTGGSEFDIDTAYGADELAISATWFRRDQGFNTALGYKAGFGSQDVTTGSYNSFIGYQAGYANTTGSNNFFGGYQSGYNNTTESQNVFLGNHAGYSNAGGVESVFIGSLSGYWNLGTVDGENVAIGYGAGYGSEGNTDYSYNVLVGRVSGNVLTTGSANVFLGYASGLTNTSGANNTFIGHRAGDSNIVGSGNVFLGNYAGHYEVGSNRLYIDNTASGDWGTASSTALVYGEFDNGLLRVNGILDIASSTATSTFAGNVVVMGNLVGSGTNYVQDLVFANAFRFYEDPKPVDGQLATGTQTLKLTNQNGDDIFTIDEFGNLTITGNLTQSSTTEESVISLGLTWILDQFKTIGVTIADGVMSLKKLIVSEEVCIGSTCINEDQLKEIINKNEVSQSTPTTEILPTPIEEVVIIQEEATTTPESVEPLITEPITESVTETIVEPVAEVVPDETPVL